MDTKQFVASLVGSLAWPGALLLLLWLFRRQVAGLLERPLKSLQAGPLQVQFDNATAEVQPLIQTPGGAPALGAASLGDLRALAGTNPKAAVWNAQERIDTKVRELLRAAGDPAAETEKGTIYVARRAADKGLIERELANEIGDLTLLAAIGSHGSQEPSTKSAMDYIGMAGNVLAALHGRPEPN